MREFVVTLRTGQRFTVRAARVAFPDHQYLALVDEGPTIADPNPAANAVALFDRRTVASVIARDHLVSEEKVDPVGPAHVVGADDDIPF